MDDELSPVEQLRKELEEAGDNKGKETPTEAPANKEKNVSKSSTAKKAAKKPAKKKPVRVAKKKQPAKKAAASKKTTRAPAKKGVKVAKKKSAPKKAAPAKKPVKAAKKAPAKKKATKRAPADASTKRTMVRDRQGDGLTPIERKIVAFIADQEEPVSVVTIGRRMFGKDCPSEGENYFRTVRNGLRFPIKYGMVDQVKVKGEVKRGLYKIGAAYNRSKGNLEKLAERYRARVAKEREAS